MHEQTPRDMDRAAGTELRFDLADRRTPIRFLLHDRDSRFSAAFDEVFRTAGAATIKTPIRAPNANAFAERWVRTVRCECLDWLLVVNRRQLERVLRTYVDPLVKRSVGPLKSFRQLCLELRVDRQLPVAAGSAD